MPRKVTYGHKFPSPVEAMEVPYSPSPDVDHVRLVGFSARGRGFFVPESEDAYGQIASHNAFAYDAEAMAELAAVGREYDEVTTRLRRRWSEIRERLVRVEVPA